MDKGVEKGQGGTSGYDLRRDREIRTANAEKPASSCRAAGRETADYSQGGTSPCQPSGEAWPPGNASERSAPCRRGSLGPTLRAVTPSSSWHLPPGSNGGRRNRQPNGTVRRPNSLAHLWAPAPSLPRPPPSRTPTPGMTRESPLQISKVHEASRGVDFARRLTSSCFNSFRALRLAPFLRLAELVAAVTDPSELLSGVCFVKGPPTSPLSPESVGDRRLLRSFMKTKASRTRSRAREGARAGARNPFRGDRGRSRRGLQARRRMGGTGGRGLRRWQIGTGKEKGGMQ